MSWAQYIPAVASFVGNALGSIGHSSSSSGYDEKAYKSQLTSSAASSLKLNKALMDYQQKLQKASRQSSYMDTRIDLESAGYNPLLAVGQQSGYMGVSSGISDQGSVAERATSSDSAMNVISTLSNAFNTSRSVTSQNKRNATLNEIGKGELLNNQAMTNSNILFNNAKIQNTNSATDAQNWQNAMNNIYGEQQIRQNLENSIKQGNLTDAQVSQVKRSIQKSYVEEAKLLSDISSNNQASAESASRTALNNQKAIQELGYTRWSNDHPILSGIVTGSQRFNLPGLRIGFSGFKDSKSSYKGKGGK